MNTTKLSNEKTKALEEISIFFLDSSFIQMKKDARNHYEILHWYLNHGLEPNQYKKQLAKLTELLREKPNYTINETPKQSVWGFKIEELGKSFLLLLSKEGLMIQIEPTFSEKECIYFIEELKKIIM